MINEIHYNPAVPFSEFIELKNISSNAVPLFDAAFPTNTWRLNGLSFSFPTNLTLPSGGFVLLVGTNVAAFTNQYTVPAGVQISPYVGNLQDSGERLALEQPDTTGTNGVGYINIDVVRYNDRAPWSPAADGSGPSLQRRLASLYGNEPMNWKAAAPTPGADTSGGDEPFITAHPQNQSAVLGSNVTFTVGVTGTPPFQFVWRLNGTNLGAANDATLFLPAIQPHQAGNYSVNVLNSAGFATSSNATLVLVTPVTFTLQPANTNVFLGSNVTLSCVATGSGTVRYQWRFEGTNLLNATNAGYSITNVSAIHQGLYSVLASDAVSLAVSSNASLSLLIRPGIVTAPQAQTVLQGRTAIFSCVATGGAPLFYRWISNGAPFVVTTVPFLVLSNAQPRPGTLLFRVIVTNVAGSTTALNSPNVTLTVLSDFDADGIADLWETQYGLSTNNAAEALLDFDGDGMSNHDEYVAGTNPTNALSVLKVIFSETNAQELRFTAQSNINYTVQWHTNLGVPTWSRLTNVTAAPQVRTISVDTTTAPLSPQRYFRVVTPLVP